jgi:serine protease Do
MLQRFLLYLFPLSLVVALTANVASAFASQPYAFEYAAPGEIWDSTYGEEGSGSGSSYLGVDIDDVTAERLSALKLKEEHGAEVTMVDEDAPAGKAGIREHDVILSVNGTKVESTAQLRRMIKETPPGRIIEIGISRDGQLMTLKVQLADRSKMKSWPSVEIPKIPEIPPVPPIPDFDLPVSVVVIHSGMRSGLMIENITPQLGEYFGVKDGKGVLVRSVEKGSNGDKAGFHAGDVVIKVNGQPVHDSSDFSHAMHSSRGGPTAITVMRDRKEQTLTLPLPAKKDSGTLIEDSLDDHDLQVETEQAINLAGDEMARLAPVINEEDKHNLDEQMNEMKENLRERQQELKERENELRQQERERAQEMREREQEMRDQERERQEEMRQRQREFQESMRERENEMRERMRELREEFGGAEI